MPQRILCAAFPNWPVQRLRSTLPDEQAAHPLVLIRRDPRRGRLIVAACDQAQRAGARPGLAASVVDALVQDQQTWLVQEHDPWLDLKALEGLAGRCTRELCPVVALEPLASTPWADQLLHQPQALFLDIAGIDHLFGGEASLMEHFAEKLSQWGWTTTLALTGTPGLSWGVAHYGLAPREFVRLPPGAEEESLQSLPLEALRLPDKIIETLYRLGIDTIGHLLPIPREELIRRFDSVLLDRVDQALGRVTEPLDLYQELPPPTASADFDYPTKDFELIERCVSTLMSDVARNLKARGEGALRLECRLRLEERPALQFDVSFFAPSAEAKHLTELLGEALQRNRLTGAVVGIRITATLVGPLAQRQLGLLPDSDMQMGSSSSLARLVDQLSSRLGREKVLGVSIDADQQPELSYRLTPLAGRKTPLTTRGLGKAAARKTVKKPSKTESVQKFFPSPSEPLRRPLCLLDPPQPIEMDAAAEGGELKQFRWQSRWYSVSRHWGPERIETGWWRGPSIRREYYRVESSDGGWWWIFQRIGDRSWFLHGRFD